MARLEVLLPPGTIEAFERMAATLALSEPGTSAPALMARTVATLAQMDLTETLKAIGPAGGMVPTALEVEDLADLERMARAAGLTHEETAARLLVSVAREGPRSAVKAVNTSTWRQPKKRGKP